MRVLVIGPGGVGGYLAFRLKKCGVDVDVLGRKKIDEIIVKEKEEEKTNTNDSKEKAEEIAELLERKKDLQRQLMSVESRLNSLMNPSRYKEPFSKDSFNSHGP